MEIDPIIKEIYKEKDISTNISIFLASICALVVYLTNSNSFISSIVAISIFSLSKLISNFLIQKFRNNINKKEMLSSFSKKEKEVIQSFIKNETSFITLKDLREGVYDFDEKAFDSLVMRGKIKFIDGGVGDGPTGFQLNYKIYKIFLNL